MPPEARSSSIRALLAVRRGPRWRSRGPCRLPTICVSNSSTFRWALTSSLTSGSRRSPRFIDMESKVNREAVASALRQALSRDKTRTQVFDISELGLVEMTRKRVNEGLLESVSNICTVCDGRGFVVETGL